ncbi:LCP family protein [Mammaliicoccus sciuri]|uniref:LCP family protein n=1 Tax=Mammaliicoccus sciuri TaxID=1296 RepID=UPI001FB34A9C|nr:LCP family protein [Mammaliicoccus sciuri]MCJ0911211.1 LCP family protein [Mammaliicoccus sciuri]
MKLTRKGKVTIIIVAIVLIAGIFVTVKAININNKVYQPINKQDTKHVKEKIKNNKPISIAIFGVDSNKERESENIGERTDSIMLASINPKTKTTKLVSVPRDMAVNIPGYSNHDKVAHAYAYGGSKTAVQTLKNEFNIPIDGYITVDMDGFKKTIDALDGVNVKSNKSFTFNGTKFKAGEKVKLNGQEALDFVRSRKEAGAGDDEGRQERQRIVIEATSKKLKNNLNVNNFNELMNVAQDNITTSFNLNDTRKLITDYKSATEHFEKISIDGVNQVESDGIWYFEADKDAKQQIVKSYKNNLKS